jgi:hypothetical protein
MGRRQCTRQYKIAPVNRKIRELLGAKPPKFDSVPRGRFAEVWIGFSTDEIYRVNDRRDSPYIVKRFPLLELGMTRDDCLRWLERRNWGNTVRSSCIGCPFHSNRDWLELRNNHPEEWQEAVEFDDAIRDGGARGLPPGTQAFVHQSAVPLRYANIELITDKDEGRGGCSPYGCRSVVPEGETTIGYGLPEWCRAERDMKPCVDCAIPRPWYVMRWHGLTDKELALMASRGQNERMRAEIASRDVVCANCDAVRQHDD